MTQFLLSNPVTIDPISPRKPYFLHPNRFHSRKSTITCARTISNKGFLQSPRSRKTLIRLARFTASNLHYVLPAPFNSVIQEFVVGDGGGGGGSGGFWKGFGWGGFDGGGGGRKRRVNKKSQFFWIWVFGAVCCLGFLLLRVNPNLGGQLELKDDVLLGAFCLSVFLVLGGNGWVPEWVLGFCSGGVLVGMLVEKKDEVQRLVRGVKGMGIRRRRRGRRVV